MSMQFESPFLDEEVLGFLQNREEEVDSEDDSFMSLRPAGESVEDYADAELLTEQEATRSPHYRMRPQTRESEAFEMDGREAHEDEETGHDHTAEMTSEAAFELDAFEAEEGQEEPEFDGKIDFEAEPESAEASDAEPDGHQQELDESEVDWELDVDLEGLLEFQSPALAEPMPVPKRNPIPFAPPPSGMAYWPVQTSSPNSREVNYRQVNGSYVGSAPGRRFLARRAGGKRLHLGVDLQARFGDPVIACEAGIIVAFFPFCCGAVKTAWALIVKHSNLVVNYGEVAPNSLTRTNLKRGSQVLAGQIIAYVGKNPRGSSMLHFETWASARGVGKPWIVGQRRPSELLNPTKYLLALRASVTPASSTQREYEAGEADGLSYEQEIVAFYVPEMEAADEPVEGEVDLED